jgi:chemotaxis protein MotB
VLFDRDNPYNPINRRISIIVMTKSAEATALSTDAADVETARKAIESGQQTSTVEPGAAAPIADSTAAPAPKVPAAAAVPATPEAALAAETAANKAAIRPASVSAQRVAAAAEAVLSAPKP